MPERNAPRDIEKIVYETAKAMALAGNGVGTPRVVKLYIDDAREVLRSVTNAAKRQGWAVEEMVLALDPPKPKLKPWERHQGTLLSSSEP
jgi:hypothetical protein